MPSEPHWTDEPRASEKGAGWDVTEARDAWGVFELEGDHAPLAIFRRKNDAEAWLKHVTTDASEDERIGCDLGILRVDYFAQFWNHIDDCPGRA